jgi:hypothetical protein
VGFPPLFHIGDQLSSVGPQFSEDLVSGQQNRDFRIDGSAIFWHTAGSARAQAEVDNLEKDPYLEVFREKR